MQTKKQRYLVLAMISGVALLGASKANATASRSVNITTFCSSNGYTLLPAYQADSCDAACHNNPAGVTAYDNGNYEYFCPPTVATAPTCTDADNDGYFAEGADCGTTADFDDANANAYPGATEICNDSIDNDGNGLVDAGDPNAVGCSTTACTDMDGDGFSTDGGSCGAIDCNDADSSVSPIAAEACGDGIDNNCNGRIDTTDMNAIGCSTNCTDQDGDGFSTEGGNCGPMDCNDNNPAINPAALEICNDGLDNNCNTQVDSSDQVCQDSQAGSQPWWRPGNNGSSTPPATTPIPAPAPAPAPAPTTTTAPPPPSTNGSHPFGWNDPESQHQDADFNVSECTSCHSIDTADSNSSMSCYSCHGQEWDDPNSSSNNNNDEVSNTNGSHPFGWNNPESQHQDADFNVSECTSCHSTDTADSNSSMSCYSCHGQEWDDPNSSSNNNNDEGSNTNGSHPFGWNNPESQHQDADFNVSECTSCHSTDRADSNSSMSCYSCHGQEWDNDGKDDDDDDDKDDDKDERD